MQKTEIVNNYIIPHMGICQGNISNVYVLKVHQNFIRIIHFYLNGMYVRIHAILQNQGVE